MVKSRGFYKSHCVLSFEKTHVVVDVLNVAIIKTLIMHV